MMYRLTCVVYVHVVCYSCACACVYGSIMDEELRVLQEYFFSDLVSRLDLKPTMTPIVASDFPNLDWAAYAEKGLSGSCVAETQLGFYDMQLPCSTTHSRVDRKLSLILDLDQTLVHAVKLNDLVGDILCPEAGAVPSAFARFVVESLATCTNPRFVQSFTSRIIFSPEVSGVVAPVPGGQMEAEPNQLLATWLENDMYLIKLRPGLRRFIRELSELYELHIYTKANRNYLNFLINELDPLGKYFVSAVARDDSPDLDIELKVLNRVCCRSINEIVVFDDRVDIWTESTGNVVRAQPYNFLHLRRMSVLKALDEIITANPDPNGQMTASALDFDCHLHYMQQVLVRIHSEFVANPKIGAPAIVTQIRRQVLAGLSVVFTGFTDVAQFTREVEEYGAVCPITIGDESALADDESSILVAAKHTKRVYSAKKTTPKVKVVHGSWLDHCRATWTVPDVSVFDHTRFRVNPDGTFGAVDSWEVAWIAANGGGTSEHTSAAGATNKRRRH